MYTNIYSRRSPGLVVVIIDQSLAMNDMYGATSCSCFVTKVINTMIGGLLLRNHNGFDIVDRAYIYILKHGDYEEVTHSYNGWLSDYEASPIREKNEIKEVPIGDGESLKYEVKLPIWIEPYADGIGNLPEAFEVTSELIANWKSRWLEKGNIESLPVPLVLNFHSGDWSGMSCSINSIERTLCAVEEIKKNDFPDGKPLVCNIIVNPNYLVKVFPQDSSNKDIEACLFKTSSIIPTAMKKWYNNYSHFSLENKLLGEERLFVSNININEMDNFCRSLFDFFDFEKAWYMC